MNIEIAEGVVTAEHLVRFWRNKFLDERVQSLRKTDPTMNYELAMAEAEHAANCCETIFIDSMNRLKGQ